MIYNQGFGGGMKPKIIVTAPTETVVTATKGTTVITAGESGGKYVILADDYGVWTVAGTKGSQSVSQDVNVVAVDTYEVTLDFTPKVLNDATWEQIRDVADASTGANYWSVGDRKQITINGKLSDGLTLTNYQTWVFIIGFDHNKDVEGTGIAFQGFKNALTGGEDICLLDAVGGHFSGQWFNMNNSSTNVGGWASCLMRTSTLPVVKAALPTDLTSVIKTTSIYTDNTGGGRDYASYVTATQDDLYLLAEWEVSGLRNYANSGEKSYQKRYDYYLAGNSRIKYKYNDLSNAYRWWLRSPYAITVETDPFVCVETDGSNTYNTAVSSLGVAPAFKVGSNPPPQPISALAVGSSVFCNVNGAKTEFIVVHQGKPSSLYDDSCNGTWLLMKDCYESSVWNSSDVNNLENSTIHSYLNSTFLNLFDSNIKDAIKQVKIPYRKNGGSGGTDQSGANGLSTKIFLPSGYEVGWTTSDSSYFPVDGAKLSYFGSGTGTSANNKRIAKLDGSATYWWLRSPHTYNTSNVWYVYSDGNSNNNHASILSCVRPAFILPFDTQVDFHGNIVI